MTSGPPPSSGTFSVIPSTATASQSLSVSALLQQTRHAPRLLSHSVLDALFQLETDERDGLPQGHVLHVTGPPGAGKSRLCASLALNAPVDHSGMQVLIIDSSEGTLAPRELLKQAQHRFNNAELQQSLGNIHRLRLTSQTEFLAMIYGGLRSWLSNHPEAKVIIIDSLSALLRASSFVNTESIQANPAPNRTGMPSSQLASSLPQGSKVNESKFTQRDHALSDLRDLIIQLTSGPNPYTTSIPKGGGHATLVPQNAERWMPPRTYTVLLRQEDKNNRRERQACLVTSPKRDHLYPDVTFNIDDEGVKPRNSPPQLPLESTHCAAPSTAEGSVPRLRRDQVPDDVGMSG